MNSNIDFLNSKAESLLIPQKSNDAYKKEYDKVIKWMEEQKHFYGMMRSAGGCNSHPESLQVGQIFRLMSIYSLVKPPRGSNVSGGHMLKTLLSMENSQQTPEKKKLELTFNIVVDNDTNLLTEAFTDYKEAFAYLCGFLANKFKNMSCPDCKINNVGHGSESLDKIITEKSRGFLTYPSELLYNILIDVEVVVSQTFKNELEKNEKSDDY